MLIADSVRVDFDRIQDELESALTQMAAYVERIESTRGLIPTGELNTILQLSQICQISVEKIGQYSLFFNTVQIKNDTDDIIEELADRFLDRARKPGLPVNTKEAMAHYGKSRSTIYRWIKNGKIPAEKHGRVWTIYV